MQTMEECRLTGYLRFHETTLLKSVNSLYGHIIGIRYVKVDISGLFLLAKST